MDWKEIVDKIKKRRNKILQFIDYFPNISSTELEKILKWLDENGFLSKRGRDFRFDLYEALINDAVEYYKGHWIQEKQ